MDLDSCWILLKKSVSLDSTMICLKKNDLGVNGDAAIGINRLWQFNNVHDI